MGMGMRISVLGVDLGKNVCSLRFRAPEKKGNAMPTYITLGNFTDRRRSGQLAG
jgi:hypothetical protein